MLPYAADLRGLAQLVPAQTRLLLDPTGKASHEDAKAPQLEAVSVPTSNIRQGDVLRVLPGERLPVDGIILSGRCSVDESMLTGEAALVPKKAGQEVGVWLSLCQTKLELHLQYYLCHCKLCNRGPKLGWFDPFVRS